MIRRRKLNTHTDSGRYFGKPNTNTDTTSTTSTTTTADLILSIPPPALYYLHAIPSRIPDKTSAAPGSGSGRGSGRSPLHLINTSDFDCSNKYDLHDLDHLD